MTWELPIPFLPTPHQCEPGMAALLSVEGSLDWEFLPKVG